VWRARDANCENARVRNARFDAIVQFNWGEPRVPARAAAKFIKDSIASISDLNTKEEASKRMSTGLVVDSEKDDTEEVWRKCEEASANVPQLEFDKKHAAFLRDLVCDAKESRQAIAKGIIRNLIANDEDRRAFSVQLAGGLLGEDGKPCAATENLDEKDVKTLRAAIARAPEPPALAAPPPVAAPAAAAAPAPAASQPK
jgi:hypothetical protein